MTQTTQFSSAVSFASHLHRNQTRKATGIPYLSHLLAVASLVMEAGGDEDEVIAALLHDAIEDQGDSYPGGRSALRERIRSDFGQRVLDIVNACTDDEGHTKDAGRTFEEEAEAWRRRKEEYIAHLAGIDDVGVLRVSCADKLHNARCVLADYRQLRESLWQRFRTKSKDDQLWVYRSLCDVFEQKGVGLAAELRDTVRRIDRGLS